VEEAVRIPCGDIELEGRLAPTHAAPLAVVLCHPHPLMGGDMNSPPIEWLSRALARRGAAVLRFNFRGAGLSGGTHDDGKAEVDDVDAALHFLHDRVPRARLALAGYSFGALVSARAAARRHDLFALGLIAPPLALTALPELAAPVFPGGLLAVVGDRDDVCPASALRDWAERCGAELELLAGEDHFLAGARGALERIFGTWLAPEAA
jgi:uncharacterized protein